MRVSSYRLGGIVESAITVRKQLFDAASRIQEAEQAVSPEDAKRLSGVQSHRNYYDKITMTHPRASAPDERDKAG